MIESVVEDLAVKLELFEELHEVCAEKTILATNTSTLPVVDLAMATGRTGQGVRHPLLQPGHRRWAWSRWSARSRPSEETIDDGHRVRQDLRQGDRRGRGPGRLRGQRAPLPLPQQRRATARARRRLQGGHRRGHGRRLRVPDGTVRAARPGRPGHLGGHPRHPLRGAPGAAVRGGPAAAPDGGGRPPRPQVAPRASTSTSAAEAPRPGGLRPWARAGGPPWTQGRW